MNLVVGERLVRRDQALRDGFGPDLLGVQPGAVVGDGNDDAAALVERTEHELAMGRLAGADPRFGVLDAVIHAVAHHVHQRVVDVLDDLPVKLGVLAAQFEVHGLARLPAQIADETGHLLEGLLHRHHAHGHGVALQVGRDALQLAQIPGQPFVRHAAQRGILLDHGLDDDQLTDHVDQVVQLPGVHLDGIHLHGFDLHGRCRSRGLGCRRRSGGRSGRYRDGTRPLLGEQGRTVVFGHSRAGRGWTRRPGRLQDNRRSSGNHGFHLRHQLTAFNRGVRGRLTVDALLQAVNHGRHDIDGFQDDVDLGMADGVFARASQIEEVLNPVSHFLDTRDAQRPGIALDRVERPEQIVQELDVAGCSFERQHRRLDRSEVVERLGEEHARKFRIGSKQLEFGIVEARRRVLLVMRIHRAPRLPLPIVT